MKESKATVIEWLLEHLPGGPESHLDDLPRIAVSLQVKPLWFLHALKKAKMKADLNRGVAKGRAKDKVRVHPEDSP